MRYATQGVFDNFPCFHDLMSFVMLCEYCYENICCVSTNITWKCKLYHIGEKKILHQNTPDVHWISCLYMDLLHFVCKREVCAPFLQRSYVSECSHNLCTGLRLRCNVSYYKLPGYCYTSTSIIIIITVDVFSCAPHCRVRRMARAAPRKGCAKTQKVMWRPGPLLQRLQTERSAAKCNVFHLQ